MWHLHDKRQNCVKEHCQGFQKKIFVKQIDQVREESPHTHKRPKRGSFGIATLSSVEEVFSSDSQDNFGRELWDKCYELFCSYGVVFWLASKTYLGFIYILVSCTTLCSDIRGCEYLFALKNWWKGRLSADWDNIFYFCILKLCIWKKLVGEQLLSTPSCRD